MKTLFINSVILLSIVASINAAQNDFKQEIIVRFEEGAVQLPLGVQSAYIEDVSFSPVGLKNTLIEHTAETISMVFPDHDPADSLLESPRFPGLFAKQDRLDLVYRIKLQNPAQRDSLNADLLQYLQVYYSYNNGMGQLCFDPDDDYFNVQWGMESEGCSFCAYDADINAPEAWDLSQGTSSTVIGIIDHGVYQEHIEFQNRISGEGPGDFDHGTHVAGIAAAKGNNDEGIAGVSWNSLIYSKDVSGWDQGDIYDSIIDAVLNHDADILNLSFEDDNFHSLESQALGVAHDLGVLIVAARGNWDGSSPSYPACNYGNYVLSVGAFDTQRELSNFSNYGSGMDILAPGGTSNQVDYDDIYSTYYRTGNQYAYKFGTSMSAPHVTGVAALLDYYNHLFPLNRNLYEVIIRSAEDLYEIGYDERSGHGKLDARAALDFISPPNIIYDCAVSSGLGNYVVDDDPPVEPWEFKGVRGLADNRAYLAKQYEVRRVVDFMGCDCNPPVNDPFIGTPIV